MSAWSDTWESWSFTDLSLENSPRVMNINIMCVHTWALGPQHVALCLGMMIWHWIASCVVILWSIIYSVELKSPMIHWSPYISEQRFNRQKLLRLGQKSRRFEAIILFVYVADGSDLYTSVRWNGVIGFISTVTYSNDLVCGMETSSMLMSVLCTYPTSHPHICSPWMLDWMH